MLAAEQEFKKAKGPANSSVLASAAVSFPPIEIEVHWHVVATNITIEGGWIPYVFSSTLLLIIAKR